MIFMRAIHFRNYDDYVKYGRYTAWTVVYFKETDKIYIGFSRCSKADNFDRSVGKNLAFFRAVTFFAETNNVEYDKSSVDAIAENLPKGVLEDLEADLSKYCFSVELSPKQTQMNEHELETKIYDEIARVFFNKIIKKHHNKKDLRIIDVDKTKIRIPKRGFWYTSKSEIVSE